ncbi:MAG TPA: restriction endonuclease, SacI family [Propionicimonas sp.]
MGDDVLFGSPRAWQLDLARAEAVIEHALAQREADRARGDFEPNEWAAIAREVYAWPKAKTYLAAVLCGLVARATDVLANPLSLQVGEVESFYGYAATSLWQTIQGQAQSRIDLRNLKSQPFNNSPFGGKRYLSTEWENVAAFNRRVLARTVELMTAVGRMSQAEAVEALRSFLSAVPDPGEGARPRLDLGEARIDLVGFFNELEQFLLDDGENGRRAQAMVAAAFALVHPDNVNTPKSVNDPSRTLAGDVRVIGSTPRGRLALYGEAKQKYTPPEWVVQFADEIKAKDAGGVGAYGALVNARATARARRVAELPKWRDELRRSGVLLAVWDNPADMVRDAIVWSALEIREAVAGFVELYSDYLHYVEVEPATEREWRERSARFGVAFVGDSEPQDR